MLDDVADVDEAEIILDPPVLPAGGFEDGIMLGIIGLDELAVEAAGDDELTPGAAGDEEVTPGIAGDEEVTPGAPGDEELTPGVAGDEELIPEPDKEPAGELGEEEELTPEAAEEDKIVEPAVVEVLPRTGREIEPEVLEVPEDDELV